MHTIFYVFWYNFFRIPKLIQTIFLYVLCAVCISFLFFFVWVFGFFTTVLTFGYRFGLIFVSTKYKKTSIFLPLIL